MSNCMVVSVATTEYYQRGLSRLRGAFERDEHAQVLYYETLPPTWPSHEKIPYGFKGFALQEAAERGADLVLWADACILPVQDTHDLWQRIERDGYWFSRNGYNNYEWTAYSAYPDLFDHHIEAAIKMWRDAGGTGTDDKLRTEAIKVCKNQNREIPHVVATTFGLNLRSEIGAAFLKEYFRLASEAKAFCGPWQNANYLGDGWPYAENPPRLMPCGPSDVRGHRHDQTAASVIAWRLGMKLTDPPEVFAYGKQGTAHDPRTILIADGSYQ